MKQQQHVKTRLIETEQEELLRQYAALSASHSRRLKRFLDGISREQYRAITENAHYDGTAYLHRSTLSSEWDGERAVFRESYLGYYNIMVQRARRFAPALPHEHEFVELYYIVRGTCEDTVCGMSLELVPGDCVLLMPHTSHCLSVPGDCFVYQAAVRASTLRDLCESFFASCENPPACRAELEAESNAFLLFHTGVEPEMLHLMEQMLQECQNPHRFFNMMLQSMLSSLLALLLNEFEPDTGGHEDAPNLERLTRYLQTHLTQVTLSSAAAHFGFSPSYFSTLVRQKTGQNFSTILKELRLAMACRLLTETGATLRTICEKTGYESVSQFSASFKQQFGISPREYRAQGKHQLVENL